MYFLLIFSTNFLKLKCIKYSTTSINGKTNALFRPTQNVGGGDGGASIDINDASTFGD